MVLSTLALLVLGCASQREQPEDPSSWFVPGEGYDVTEHVEFTDQPYDDFGAPQSIEFVNTRVFPTGTSDYVNDIVYGPDENLPDNDCDYGTDSDLPAEVEGVVTILPDMYFKTIGCDYGDEKYYGNYFIQDRTGGLFILGDSKVAHFDMGDRVRMKIRAARTTYGLDMVYGHDILEVKRGPQAIYYQQPEGRLGAEHVTEVQRVHGEVINEVGDFGEQQLEGEDGTIYDLSIDSELGRRGFNLPVGAQITATGPVLFSYDIYSIIIMRVGQIQVHE